MWDGKNEMMRDCFSRKLRKKLEKSLLGGATSPGDEAVSPQYSSDMHVLISQSFIHHTRSPNRNKQSTFKIQKSKITKSQTRNTETRHPGGLLHSE
jgi:hypothetical protein